MKKVLVLGPSGSGKTTLGLKLGQTHNLKCLHLDSIAFKPNWILRGYDDINEDLHKFMFEHDRWVMDGNWRKLLFHERLQAADTIIYLDYGLEISKNGVMERYEKYKGGPRPDVPQCIDNLDKDFLDYIENFEENSGKYLKQLIRGIKDKQVLIFQNREETNDYFK